MCVGVRVCFVARQLTLLCCGVYVGHLLAAAQHLWHCYNSLSSADPSSSRLAFHSLLEAPLTTTAIIFKIFSFFCWFFCFCSPAISRLNFAAIFIAAIWQNMYNNNASICHADNIAVAIRCTKCWYAHILLCHASLNFRTFMNFSICSVVSLVVSLAGCCRFNFLKWFFHIFLLEKIKNEIIFQQLKDFFLIWLYKFLIKKIG